MAHAHTLIEKWQLFLDRYHAAETALDPDQVDPGDLALVQYHLARALQSSNGRVPMQARAGLDPINLSYFLKQQLQRKYEGLFAQLAKSQLRPFAWYADHEIAAVNDEGYRLAQERWQVHARIGFCFIHAAHSIHVDMSELIGRADSYSLVVYKDKVTVASVGSLSDEPVTTIPVEPGNYRCVFRCYADGDALHLPKILVDDTQAIDASKPDDPDQFRAFVASWMARKPSPVHMAHNFHTFYWLRYGRDSDEELVRNDFLPVANPDTRWVYGALDAGCEVRFSLPADLLAHYNVYLTYLSEMSLPSYRVRVTEPSFVAEPSRVDGAYHVRFVGRDSSASVVESALRDMVSVS